jgi:hypothetical protein
VVAGAGNVAEAQESRNALVVGALSTASAHWFSGSRTAGTVAPIGRETRPPAAA